jgi:hypothetical protein
MAVSVMVFRTLASSCFLGRCQRFKKTVSIFRKLEVDGLYGIRGRKAERMDQSDTRNLSMPSAFLYLTLHSPSTSQLCHFSPEDGDSTILRNVGNDPQNTWRKIQNIINSRWQM